jgi:hypothetical protein
MGNSAGKIELQLSEARERERMKEKKRTQE